MCENRRNDRFWFEKLKKNIEHVSPSKWMKPKITIANTIQKELITISNRHDDFSINDVQWNLLVSNDHY